ncbi:hypothetical protein AB0D40_01700 [Streptomyces massasporeus]|uniref:hypothetical protein n=1 Tax=Streptomyces massasporeus TaxID=67324 RepID=UPI0033ECD9D5
MSTRRKNAKTAREQWQETGLVITTRRKTPIEPRHLNRHSYMYADMTEKRAALDKPGDLLSDE